MLVCDIGLMWCTSNHGQTTFLMRHKKIWSVVQQLQIKSVTKLWLGGVVVRALDLRLEVAGSIPAAALSSATLDKLFTQHTLSSAPEVTISWRYINQFLKNNKKTEVNWLWILVEKVLVRSGLCAGRRRHVVVVVVVVGARWRWWSAARVWVREYDESVSTGRWTLCRCCCCWGWRCRRSTCPHWHSFQLLPTHIPPSSFNDFATKKSNHYQGYRSPDRKTIHDFSGRNCRQYIEKMHINPNSQWTSRTKNDLQYE